MKYRYMIFAKPRRHKVKISRQRWDNGWQTEETLPFPYFEAAAMWAEKDAAIRLIDNYIITSRKV